MTKKQIGANTFVFPMPVTLLGTVVNGKPNFMTLGWVSRVNANPPMIGCGVGKHHLTAKGIEESRIFSINFPPATLMRETDYCGIVSGSDTDKSALFNIFYGEHTNVPMIAQCPLNIECRLVQIIENQTNNFYIGEIVDSYADEDTLTEGKPDIEKINPFVLTMPDNRYWAIGEHIGDAWSAGKSLK
jgi:flavin reductase (DIM6/NTAB) family NADH-FMN oxidoreductase RutF